MYDSVTSIGRHAPYSWVRALYNLILDLRSGDGAAGWDSEWLQLPGIAFWLVILKSAKERKKSDGLRFFYLLSSVVSVVVSASLSSIFLVIRYCSFLSLSLKLIFVVVYALRNVELEDA
jgi:hypothetical protein